MIVSFNRDEPELKTFEEWPTTPEERAQNLKNSEEWRRNIRWFGDHVKELRDQHSGKYIVIFGQELFVGDDPLEVHARADAAHPELKGGSYARRLSTLRGPRVHANQR